MALYQFLIAVRSGEGGGPQQQLTNEVFSIYLYTTYIYNKSNTKTNSKSKANEDKRQRHIYTHIYIYMLILGHFCHSISP